MFIYTYECPCVLCVLRNGKFWTKVITNFQSRKKIQKFARSNEIFILRVFSIVFFFSFGQKWNFFSNSKNEFANFFNRIKISFSLKFEFIHFIKSFTGYTHTAPFFFGLVRLRSFLIWLRSGLICPAPFFFMWYFFKGWEEEKKFRTHKSRYFFLSLHEQLVRIHRSVSGEILAYLYQPFTLTYFYISSPLVFYKPRRGPGLEPASSGGSSSVRTHWPAR